MYEPSTMTRSNFSRDKAPVLVNILLLFGAFDLASVALRYLPTSRRSITREGVPTPIPILRHINQYGDSSISSSSRSDIPCFFHILYSIFQFDMLREELSDYSVLCLKSTQGSESLSVAADLASSTVRHVRHTL